MGVNLNSNWLPCAQYGLELGLAAMCTMWIEFGQLVAMCIEHRLSKCLFTMEISQWQTNVFYVVQFTNFQGGKNEIF
jgi:hypothetical protein